MKISGIIFIFLLQSTESWILQKNQRWKLSGHQRIVNNRRIGITKTFVSHIGLNKEKFYRHPRKGLITSLKMGNINQSTNQLCTSPIGLTLDQLSDQLGGRGRALSCWECYRKGVDPNWIFDPEITNDSIEPEVKMLENSGWPQGKLVGRGPELGVKTLTLLKSMPSVEKDVAQLSLITKSKDGTTKLLLVLKDGLKIETVIIPWEDRKRSTLCISSQVGCRQGCTFCATGQMGIIRSLRTEEILVQVYYANKICRIDGIHEIDNIVFMGMGEPADNACEVVKAAKTLVHPNMFGLTSRRVTISTVGPNPDCFKKLMEAPVTLAWSVHATRQKIRKALVPTTKHSMRELRGGLLEAIRGRSRALSQVMLEITLLDGTNDSYEDAMDLVEFCEPIKEQSSKLIVNLIPWNNISATSGAASLFQQPALDSVLGFQDILKAHGIRCYVRTTRGDEESSACGQLATRKTEVSTKRRKSTTNKLTV